MLLRHLALDVVRASVESYSHSDVPQLAADSQGTSDDSTQLPRKLKVDNSTFSSPGYEQAATVTHICFIIRTYCQHGPSGSGGLKRLLAVIGSASAEAGLDTFEALLLVLDSRPFPELHTIVASLDEPRIKIFLEEVSPDHQAKLADGSNWRPEFHQLLYKLTDQAIAECSPKTQWVVVTNGDNQYDPAFITELMAAPHDAGIVAFDFYSRYQRPTVAPCERFAAGPNLPPCKENALRFCQTDLAGNVLNWQRLQAEGRAFSKVNGGVLGVNDGLLIQALVRDGWPVHRVGGRCLVSHMPNPQACAMEGGVWDDRHFDSFAGSGGSCITRHMAEQLMSNHPGLYELVEAALSHDSKAFVESGSNRLSSPAACLRRVPRPGGWRNTFYPQACTAPCDEMKAQ